MKYSIDNHIVDQLVMQIIESKGVCLYDNIQFENPLPKKQVKIDIKHKINTQVGVYFFMMEWDNKIYSIYVGCSTDIFRRIKEYLAPFQQAQPNDHKLKDVTMVLQTIFQNPIFKLYFIPCSEKDRYKLESRWKFTLNSLMDSKKFKSFNDVSEIKKSYRTLIQNKVYVSLVDG